MATAAEVAATITRLDTSRRSILARYDFHMGQVRKGADADLRDMHLRAAQREYDAAEVMRSHTDRLIDEHLRA